MEKELLIEADRIVAGLTPGKQEAVREIMVEAKRRGFLDGGARQFLNRATQSSLVGDVLAQALAETAVAPEATAAPIEAPGGQPQNGRHPELG